MKNAANNEYQMHSTTRGQCLISLMSFTTFTKTLSAGA